MAAIPAIKALLTPKVRIPKPKMTAIHERDEEPDAEARMPTVVTPVKYLSGEIPVARKPVKNRWLPK